MNGPRLGWADTAKGACILLVVLWHVTRKDYLQLPWDVSAPVVGAWGELSVLLLPVRMPLFFLISGLFAARQLSRPWRDVLTRRVAPLLYLFALWTLIHTAVLRLSPGFDTAVAKGPVDLLAGLTVTPGNLWYLLALAVYVAVARAARAHPHLAMTGALLLSAVASAQLVPTPGNRYGLLANLLYFLVGTRLPHLRPPGRAAMLAVTTAFALGAAAWQLQLVDQAWLGVRPLLGLLGAGAGATAAVGLARVERVGDALAAVGRQTLPVYVLHLPLVALAHLGSSRLVTEERGSWLPLALGYPVALTAVVATACLALHRLLLAAGAGSLFTAPWLAVRQEAAPAPRTPRRLDA